MCGEYEKLREPIQKLCELHKRDFGFCFCIGWIAMMRMSSKETGHPVCSIIKVNYPNHFTNFLLKRLKSFIASSKQMTRLISIRSYLLYTFLSKNLKH